MTYAEAGAAMSYRDGAPGTPTANGLLRVDHDPDELFWLVAVSGPDLPQGRGGPYRPNASPPPPTAWILFETAATAGGRSASTGAQYSVAGTWPAGFDALPDRCR